jgi:hypothetical protein
MDAAVAKPWYREPWPWIIMSGPFAVIIASFVSAWYAISTTDGLVSDDYYKQGLNVEQTLARSEKAQQLGLTATMALKAGEVSVQLATVPGRQTQMPPAIWFTLSHPTRAGLDQSQLLRWDGQRYSGKFRLPASGHWLVLLEDDAKSWRLLGSVVLPASGDLVIGGEPPAGNRN